MSTVKVLASGSSGNGYLIETDNYCLIIEAVVRLSYIKTELNYDMSKICGCIITHEHKDHSRYINEYLKSGIRCCLSKGTKEVLNINSPYLQEIYSGSIFKVGEYKILPFDTKHDCKEPVGYLINHRDFGNLMFATDTYYLPNKFRNLNNIMIECNYSKELLDLDNIPINRKKRILNSHMSIDTCVNTLKANNLRDVRGIMLIHLSNDHSNAEGFKKRIEKETGIPVIIAEKDVVMRL